MDQWNHRVAPCRSIEELTERFAPSHEVLDLDADPILRRAMREAKALRSTAVNMPGPSQLPVWGLDNVMEWCPSGGAAHTDAASGPEGSWSPPGLFSSFRSERAAAAPGRANSEGSAEAIQSSPARADVGRPSDSNDLPGSSPPHSQSSQDFNEDLRYERLADQRDRIASDSTPIECHSSPEDPDIDRIYPSYHNHHRSAAHSPGKTRRIILSDISETEDGHVSGSRQTHITRHDSEDHCISDNEDSCGDQPRGKEDEEAEDVRDTDTASKTDESGVNENSDNGSDDKRECNYQASGILQNNDNKNNPIL